MADYRQVLVRVISFDSRGLPVHTPRKAIREITRNYANEVQRMALGTPNSWSD